MDSYNLKSVHLKAILVILRLTETMQLHYFGARIALLREEGFYYFRCEGVYEENSIVSEEEESLVHNEEVLVELDATMNIILRTAVSR